MFHGSRLKLLPAGATVLLMVLSGCSLGSSALRGNRPAYNQAIQGTEKQELLLNIVRTRFGEPLKFLQVASIVSSFSYAAGINANGTVPISSAPVEVKGPSILNIGGGLNYAEAPTVTYVPLEGAQFATQLLTEAPVDTLLLLLQGGWNIEQVISIMVDRISSFSNNPAAVTFKQFEELVQLWRAIQARGDMVFVRVLGSAKVLGEGLPAESVDMRVFGAARGDEFYVSPEKGKSGTYALEKDGRMSTVIQVTYASQEEANRVSTLLGSLSTRPKDSLVERFALIDASVPEVLVNFDEPITKLVFNMRSFVNQLFHVAQGVKLDTADQKIAIPIDTPAQKALAIHRSDTWPGDAFVSVQHRDSWYFIKHEDYESKLNFNLLLMILAMQSTEGGAAPALTLPVGG